MRIDCEQKNEIYPIKSSKSIFTKRTHKQGSKKSARGRRLKSQLLRWSPIGITMAIYRHMVLTHSRQLKEGTVADDVGRSASF